jgi:hypothetical protein
MREGKKRGKEEGKEGGREVKDTMKGWGWGCSSVECLPSVHEALEFDP